MKKLLFVSGAICLLYGLIILSILGFAGLFNYFFAAFGIFLLLLGAFWDKLSDKFQKVLKILMAIGLAAFVTVEGIIIHDAVSKPVSQADYVIVLGSRVRNNGPSVDFKARIDAAYEYLIANPDTMVITTGGQGSDEPMPEALSARNYLVDRGISEDRILMEDKITSTVENLSFSKKIIEGRGEDTGKVTVVISSASYHLCRAEFIAGKCGFENVSGLASNGLVILMPHSYTREFFALIKDFIKLSH